MQKLHTHMLDPKWPRKIPSGALTGNVSAELITASQKVGSLDQDAQQEEDARAPKRLCLPASPVGASSQSLLQLLMSRLSILVNCENGDNLTSLAASMM